MLLLYWKKSNWNLSKILMTIQTWHKSQMTWPRISINFCQQLAIPFILTCMYQDINQWIANRKMCVSKFTWDHLFRVFGRSNQNTQNFCLKLWKKCLKVQKIIYRYTSLPGLSWTWNQTTFLTSRKNVKLIPRREFLT